MISCIVVQKATLAFTVMLRLVSPSHCNLYQHYLLIDVDWRKRVLLYAIRPCRRQIIYETRAPSCDTYQATSRHPVYPTFRVRKLHGSSTRHSALHSELQPSRRIQAFLSAGILIAQMPAKVMGSVPPVLEAPAPGHNQRLPRSTFRGATSFSRLRDRDILATG